MRELESMRQKVTEDEVKFTMQVMEQEEQKELYKKMKRIENLQTQPIAAQI